MYKNLRKKAEKRVQAKVAFYICAIVFAFISIILLMMASYLPTVAFWLKLPIPVFIMVLCILYINAFGLPMSDTLSGDWQEEEIEREMVKLYHERKSLLPPDEELTEEEKLDLIELERLEEKHTWRNDY